MIDFNIIKRLLLKGNLIKVPTPPKTTVITAFPETLKYINSGETNPLNMGYKAPETPATIAAKINAIRLGVCVL
jgi:hypothetical protein